MLTFEGQGLLFEVGSSGEGWVQKIVEFCTVRELRDVFGELGSKLRQIHVSLNIKIYYLDEDFTSGVKAQRSDESSGEVDMFYLPWRFMVVFCDDSVPVRLPKYCKEQLNRYINWLDM